MVNNNEYDQEGETFAYESPTKEPLPLSIFLVLPFLIGSVAVASLPGYNYLVIGLGILCTAVFLLASVRDGFFVPTELKLFAAFIVLSMLGLFVARVPVIVIERLRTVVQLLVMAMIISYYARNVRCVSWLFLGVLAAVLLIAASAIYTGEYRRSEDEGEAGRVAGLVMNANAFAIAVTYGVATLLFFFRQTRSITIKLLIVVGILTAVRFVVASGSRKGFLALAILIFFWFLLTYGRELRQRPAVALAMGAGVVLLGVFMMVQLRDTTLMQRFLRLRAEAGLEGASGEGVRLVMIREGVQFTLSNPLTGVGLNNYTIHSSVQKASHNNYIEMFSTTGIPGGILYHLIYFVILRRFFILRKQPLSPRQQNTLITLLCLMIVILFLDIGIVSYYLKTTWILLAIIIGYINALQREIAIDSEHSVETYENDSLLTAAEY